MCNTSIGYNRMGSLELDKANVLESNPETWPCPKTNTHIYWEECHDRERNTPESEHGGKDCWECKNILKLRRAEWAHKDDWNWQRFLVGIAIVVGAAVVLGWLLSKLF